MNIKIPAQAELGRGTLASGELADRAFRGVSR